MKKLKSPTQSKINHAQEMYPEIDNTYIIMFIAFLYENGIYRQFIKNFNQNGFSEGKWLD